MKKTVWPAVLAVACGMCGMVLPGMAAAQAGAGQAEVMRAALDEARLYQRHVGRLEQARAQISTQAARLPHQRPLLRVPDAQMHGDGQTGMVFAFASTAPAPFAGRRLVLGGRDLQACWTDAPLAAHPSSCMPISPAAMQRIMQARQWYVQSTQTAKQDRQRQQERTQDERACADWEAALPADYTALHIDQPATGRHGREVKVQLKGDDSGGDIVYLAEVRINQPGKPVVLQLTSYYPTIWQIAHAPGTRIAAVWASGYHRPYPIGLAADVPVLTTSYDAPRCKGRPAQALPRLSVSPVKYGIREGQPLTIGEAAARWISSGPGLAGVIRPANEPLSGTQGVQQLQARGDLRPVTERELAAVWAAARGSQGVDGSPDRIVQGHYRILRPITFPSGMYGGYAASFHLPDGVPFPRGDVGHNSLYLPSGFCVGGCH